ncbi:MAG: hypothetical protein FJ202_00080 [Gemmatimonadetes bacterium]|nr:hypothetical protein [Gemmatimonadota bacterium]
MTPVNSLSIPALRRGAVLVIALVAAQLPGGAAAQSAPAAQPTAAPALRSDFVRNQTLIGAAIYAPAFASTFAKDGVAWTAGYMLVAGGSFVASAEISRRIAITNPMQRLATGLPVRGAVAGLIAGSVTDAGDRATAVSVLLGSVGGTAAALTLGKPMNDGEAAATLLGSDLLGLTALGIATAAGVEEATGRHRVRGGLALAGMIVGAPLGHAYAALAPYHVSPGDLTAMTAAAGIGMLAGLSFVTPYPTDREAATALTVGGLAGVFAGDRFFVRRYDHSPGEGRLVAVGAIAGGLMGAGATLLVRGEDADFDIGTGLTMTAGAAGGMALAHRYMRPKGDGGLRTAGLSLNPIGVVAALSGLGGGRNSYTIGSFRF